MKKFLRILAIIFLLVVIVILIKSGFLSGNDSSTSEIVETVSEETVSSEEVSAEISETEEEIQDIINPVSEEDDGVVILGGDGIPNN
jgi:diacylglycerol kinase family enzyme